jgi:predicted house-cleaning noncanonical NTP pyrophosphatase (MazG superfamily)
VKDKMPSHAEDYFTLKEFLGVKCFEDVINNVEPKRLSKLNDELKLVLQIIGNDPKREEKQKSLKKKLKSKFYDTLPEIEWAAYFGNKNLPVIIEPCFPGPDLKVKVKDRWINIEITNRRLSKEMQELDRYSKDINSGIEKIKSHFSIAVAFRASFSKEDLFPLIKTIKKRIGDFEKKRILKPVTTYYISLNNSKDWYDFDGINEPKDLYTNPKKYPLFDVMRTAKAKIMFHPRDNLDYTYVGSSGPARLDFGDIDRIKSKLHKKQNRQLPKNEPNVIILHNAWIFDIVGALYGKLQITTVYNRITGEIIEEYPNRDNSGIFQSSTRVTAVLFVGYDEDHDFKRKVFQNPKAKNPLCEEEIKIIEGM